MGANSNLHSYTVQQPYTNISRVHLLFHLAAVICLFYYRLSHLLYYRDVPLLSWGLTTLAELSLGLAWFFHQPFRLRLVIREAHPENIPGDAVLPGVDVFICTVDPSKEPTVDVMNTVISAMALNYPPEKLAVYLSDDGGVPLTLFAVREAFAFARHWVKFCRKYGIKTICPHAYLSKMGDDEHLLRSTASEFMADDAHIKSQYELFKKKVEEARTQGKIKENVVPDRPPYIEVIHDNNKMDSQDSDDQTKLPLLVYVSRESRPSYPHRFKGGALNALLRVSGLMSNAPYILVLDCDMFCNEPDSARQAMCFHLDPKTSHSLSFVQYPQIFHNIGKDDIYNAQGRTTYRSQWHGMDGLRGPVLSGTGYYMKRKSLFQAPNQEEMPTGMSVGKETDGNKNISKEVSENARNLATCTFEQNTDWGKEIGFSYECLLESSYTGYLLHCRGWRSAYYYPKRPAFLGCAPNDLKAAASLRLKWISGLFQIGLSRFNPFTYGMLRMPIFQCMCYAAFMYCNLFSVSLLLYATVPQFCFSQAVPLYPKVSSPWFAVFAIVLASSVFAQLYEVLSTGGTIKMCWNEYRIWMIQSVTGVMFGGLDAVSKKLGMGKTTFRLTNKAIDEEKLKRIEKGKFDFQGATMFVIPLAILITFNAVCFVVGVKGMITEMNFEDMFGQCFLSSFILYLSYSIIEGIATMKS